MPYPTTKDKDEVRRILRPGCVINTVGHPEPYEFWMQTVYHFIREVQRKEFPYGWWWDTHSVFYPGGDRVFECTFPVVKETPLEKILEGDLTIWYPDIRMDELTEEMAAVYWDAAFEAFEEMKGTHYDIPDLVDMLLAYSKNRAKYRRILGSKNRFVCSTYVAYLHEAGRKAVEKRFNIDIDRLFLGPTILIEMVTPAHFSNRPDAFGQVWPIPGSETDLRWRRRWMHPKYYRIYARRYAA